MYIFMFIWFFASTQNTLCFLLAEKMTEGKGTGGGGGGAVSLMTVVVVVAWREARRNETEGWHRMSPVHDVSFSLFIFFFFQIVCKAARFLFLLLAGVAEDGRAMPYSGGTVRINGNTS